MGKVFIIALIIVYALSPFARMLAHNLHRTLYYSGKDVYHYFKEKQWERFGKFGIDMYIGMFGAGKTLTMTHEATQLYKRYGDNLRFISNYHLVDIPYIPLINFKQLVDLGDENDDSLYVGTVVLIDEISTVLSHRNFSNFPLEMLSMLLQQRKRHIYIMCTAQRFFMVDKIWRSITTRAIDCNKIWRFANLKMYDAWDYEQAVNSSFLRAKRNGWWFVRDLDYNAYDTSEMISKSSAEDFISNEEAIIRKGLESVPVSHDNISTKKLSKGMRRARSVKRK